MKWLFLTSSVNFVAHDIAKRINQKNLKLAFIKTASEVEEGDLEWLKNDRQALIDAGFLITDFTITSKTKEDIKLFLKDFDVIFFSGGNTFYLLEQIQQTKCKQDLINFIEDGKIYIGSSAGSVIAGPDIYPVNDLDNITKAPNLNGYQGLGLVDFVILPHWGSEKFKDRYLNQKMETNYNDKNKLILLNDNQFVYVENDIYKIVDIRHV